MNLLEIYIKKIHSVEPYNTEWTREFPDKEFVKVDVTTDCYGNVRREQRVFNTQEWEEIKKKGYWMG